MEDPVTYNIQGDELVLHQVGELYNKLYDSGAFRWNRRDKSMRAPLTAESLKALLDITGRLPEHLYQVLYELDRREQMLQHERESLDQEAVPLTDYPVKANLMRHQVAGANMALIVFGILDKEDNNV